MTRPPPVRAQRRTLRPPAFNVSDVCDRSGWAASALAALQLQRSLQDTTLHFWHLACSGATIYTPGGHAFGYNAIDDGGLLNPYTGVHHTQKKPPLEAQLTRLENLMDETGLPVSRLLITAGANDTGWAVVLQQCLIAKIVTAILNPLEATLAEDGCLNGYTVPEHSALMNLPSHFAKLAEAINSLSAQRPGQLSESNVYLTQYFDPLDSLSRQPLVCPGEPLAGQGLRQWGVQAVEKPLQQGVMNAAGTYHWHLIDGIRRAFQGHGVCQTSAKRWINSLDDSLFEQSDNYGTWHANRTGQRQIARITLDAIAPGFT